MLSVDHGAPVESVLMFPGGSSFITAGGNYIKVWDAIGATRALHTFSNHQKTVTCMTFDNSCSRLISGSLDRQLKIYDVKDYKVRAMLFLRRPDVRCSKLTGRFCFPLMKIFCDIVESGTTGASVPVPPPCEAHLISLSR